MKKQIKSLALLLLVAATWTGCTDELMVEKTTTDTSKGTTLIASMGENNPQTRIDFTDNGTNGIDLNWSAGDEFTVFKKSDKTRVGNFVLKSGEGSKQGIFEAIGNTNLENNTEYIALYPAVSTTSSANYNYLMANRSASGYIASGNNSMEQLNNMLHMTTEFTYSGAEVGTQIVFKHEFAMLTIKLPANATPDAPAKVSMHSSLNDYADVQFIDVDQTSEITAYTMMKPATGSRSLTFAVITTTGKVYTQTINTDKEYVAGKRYTATLNGLTEFTTGVNLASFQTGAPTGDIWMITDGGAPTTAEFAGLRTQLDAIAMTGRKIELIFPAMVTIPANAFNEGNPIRAALASVSCPQATTLGTLAFKNCTNLTSIYLPNATNISDALNAVSLTSLYLPKLTTITTSMAFWGCGELTTINLPKVTSLATYTFGYCYSLKSLTIATEATLTNFGVDPFYGLSTLNNITITTGSGTATDNSWIVGGKTYGSFKKVIINGAP